MSRVLFVTWDGAGNVPPALALAGELAARGHDVRVIGHASLRERVSRAGLDFQAYRTARAFDSLRPGSDVAVLGVFADRAMGRDVLDELRDRPADLVVVDCLLFGVMAQLRGAGHRYAVLEHSLDGSYRRDARKPLGLLLRARGLRMLDLIDAGEPVVGAALPELDAGHGEVTHVGPIVAGGEPAPAGPRPPTVLLSLSTFGFKTLAPTWQRALDAVDGLPARVIATTGPAIDPGELRVPSGVEMHQWLPHADVMREATLLVGHGGHGTTMTALAHDVPVLVMPTSASSDQPFVGRAVEAAGAGRTLPRTAPAARIRSAIEALLAPGPHRDAAARLGARIRELDGRRRGADLLEAQLAARR